MNALCTRPLWLAFAQPHVPRGIALGRAFASFIVLCAVIVSGQRTAAAGCRYWSASHAAHGPAMDLADMDLADMDLTDVNRSDPAIGFLSPELAHPTPVPCDGPNCGQAPLLPVQPVSANVPSPIKFFGCRSRDSMVAEGFASETLAAERLDAELAGYPLRIDRPPVL